MKTENKNNELDKLEAILTQARRICEVAEVFLATAEETPVHLEANRVKSIRSRESRVAALRIFKDGRIGYATSNDLTDIRALINSAVETASFGAPVDFALPPPAAYPALDIYDASVPQVPLDDMLAQVQGLVEELTRHTPGLLCEGGVSRDSASICMASTTGLAQCYTRTEYGLALEGVLTRGTDMLFVGDEMASCHVINDVTLLKNSLIRQLDWARRTASVSSGKMPVIFMPYGLASAFLDPLVTGFNGKLVLEKASPMADKAGQKLLDDKFSLFDDATLSNRPTSHPFDDEGIPSCRCPLVENGIVAGYYYDIRTAALAGKNSTGHGRRGASQPTPAPSAFVIPAGNTPFDDMLSDIKEGLVVEQVMGATQGNVMAGDFSGNVLLGYKIENGKIVGRVKDTVISGNVYALLKEIVALGDTASWAGGLLTPPIYFPALSVASKA